MKKIILPLLISLIATSCGATSDTSIPTTPTTTTPPTECTTFGMRILVDGVWQDCEGTPDVEPVPLSPPTTTTSSTSTVSPAPTFPLEGDGIDAITGLCDLSVYENCDGIPPPTTSTTSFVPPLTVPGSTVTSPPTTTSTTTTPTTTTTVAPAATSPVVNTPVSNDSKIDLINFSATPTSDLMNWANFASSKMAERTANILIVTYNIGEYLGGEIPGMPFNTNEIVLSQSEIDLLMAQIEQWMLNDSCMGHNEERGHLSEELESYRFWLENGADTSTHRGLCERTRFVMMAWKDGQPTWDLQRFLVHELYHAFQRDIANDCNDTIDRMGRGEYVHAVVEGAADYFTFFTADEIYTDEDRENYDRIGYKNPADTLLRDAIDLMNEDGTNDVTGSGIATRAAVMLRLMMEKGWLSHESILDGSFHHNCARAELNPSNPDFVFAWENWFRIEEQNGVYKFEDSVLNN